METDVKPTFTDNKGESWDMTLNYGHIEDLKEIGVDLDVVTTDVNKFVDIILSKPQMLVAIPALICAEQIQTRQLSSKQFASRFDRPTMDRMTTALMQAIILFYPRTAAGKVLAERIPALIQQLDERTETAARKKLASHEQKLYESWDTVTAQS